MLPKYSWLLLKFRYDDVQSKANKGCQTYHNPDRYANNLWAQIKNLQDKLVFQEQANSLKYTKILQEKQQLRDQVSQMERDLAQAQKRIEGFGAEKEALKRQHESAEQELRDKVYELEKQLRTSVNRNNAIVFEVRKQNFLTQPQLAKFHEIVKWVGREESAQANLALNRENNSENYAATFEKAVEGTTYDQKLFQEYKSNHLLKKKEQADFNLSASQQFTKKYSINLPGEETPALGSKSQKTLKLATEQTPQSQRSPLEESQSVGKGQLTQIATSTTQEESVLSSRRESLTNQQFPRENFNLQILRVHNLKLTFSEISIKLEVFKNQELQYQRYYNQYQIIPQTTRVRVEKNQLLENNSTLQNAPSNFWTAYLNENA